MGLVATLVVTGFYYFLVRPSSWTRAGLMAVLKHPSTWLDLQLLIGRQLLRMLIGSTSLLSGWLVATRGVRWLDQSLGTPDFTVLPGVGLAILYTVVLFVSWDLSRFILHFFYA